MIYEYRTVRSRSRAWSYTTTQPYASWRGEVGYYTDEGIVMTGSDATLQGLEQTSMERLEATIRPLDPTPPSEGGLYVHRWFQVRVDDVALFVELSGEAWPGMEAAHPGVRIIGLWRNVYRPDHLLLITRYVDYAQWEASRYYAPRPTPGAEEAYDRFRRRAQLTQRTIARFTRLVTA